ncbi:hypothetical protein [Streptomyces sp. ODS28]|uniref:hypothetical protein n=1 Tax=Streptomyces sp. ODS28 TaxID=3136688 RepID=UPI0031E7B53B
MRKSIRRGLAVAAVAGGLLALGAPGASAATAGEPPSIGVPKVVPGVPSIGIVPLSLPGIPGVGPIPPDSKVIPMPRV